MTCRLSDREARQHNSSHETIGARHRREDKGWKRGRIEEVERGSRKKIRKLRTKSKGVKGSVKRNFGNIMSPLLYLWFLPNVH